VISPRRAWRVSGRRSKAFCFVQLILAAINVWAATLAGPFWPINLAVAAFCLGFAWYHLILGYRTAQSEWMTKFYERKGQAPWN
jgi:uncharacterized RDD family membrane protein YckC